MRLPLIILAAAIAMLVAACNGGDAEDASPTASPTPSPAPTLAPGVTPGPGVTDTEIRLGMTSDLTGAGGTPYGVVTEAIQAYFTKVNQEGEGVCGRNLVLVARDDKYDPNEALAQTQALVNEDQVLAVIGAFNTKAHLAVATYLNDPNGDGNMEDGVPDMFVSTGFSGWGDVGRSPWTIGFVPGYQTDSFVLARYINDNLGDKKVGILYQEDAFGNDYVFALKATLPNPELLVSEQPLDPAATEVAPFVTNLMEAGAEVVVLATPPEVTSRVISAAHGLGYYPKFVLSYVNSPTQLAALIGGGTDPGQLAAGIREMTGAISTSYMLSSVHDEDDPALVEHERVMQTFEGPAVSTLTIYAQSLAETVVESLKRSCQELTRYGVIVGARGIQGVHPSLFLPGINVNLSPQDHLAVQAMQLVEYEEDGTIRKIGEPVSLE
jgi:ABC-type branched-subunit amino acid transport system substrate-binding protein